MPSGAWEAGAKNDLMVGRGKASQTLQSSPNAPYQILAGVFS
jgi:hypothetical protein